MTRPLRLLAALLLSLAAPLAGQDPTGLVTGTVASEAGVPLPGAAVAVRGAADTVLAASAAADSAGRFRVRGLAPGRYSVRVSHPGHAPRDFADVVLTAAEPVRDLGTVRLAAAAVSLEGLEVRAERSAVAIAPDRTLYSVKEMPVSAGGTATDVLRNVPELEVDLNGGVSMRGSAGVTIHLNGRPAPVRGEALGTFLQQFPANRIERIEVIPNPSARHDPEGTGGIVNIVLKDNADLGLSGSLSLNGGTRGSRGGSARIAYQEGRLTLFGGASGNLYRRSSTSFDLRENLAAQPVTYLSQDLRSRNEGSFGMMDLSAELRVREHATVYSALSGYASGSDSDGTSQYLITDAARFPLQRYDRHSRNGWDGRSLDTSLGIRLTPQPQKHEFTLELRRSDGANESRSRIVREMLTAEGAPGDVGDELTLTDSGEDTRDLSLQADYTRPWAGEGKLETGYRGMLRRNTDADRTQTFGDPAAAPLHGTESEYEYREDTHAVYLTLGHSVGKVGIQGGLRAEQAVVGMEFGAARQGFERSYRSLFPSASLSYDLGGGRQARLSYSKRIERPWPFFLNPFVPVVDSLNRMVGNPELRPKYTHSLSGDVSWTASVGTLRVSPYYRRTVDNWEQLKRVDTAGVSVTTWENVASIESYGTTFTASLRPAGRVSGFASLSGYRELRDATNLSEEYSADVLRWSASANTTVKVNSRLSLQSMVRYSPPRDMPQGRMGSMVMSSIGARQQLLGEKAWVNLSVMDPFDLWRYSFETRDRTHVQTSRSSWGMRSATLSFTYSFGRPPQQARRSQTEAVPQGQPEPGIH
jgi:hypothetical protein